VENEKVEQRLAALEERLRQLETDNERLRMVLYAVSGLLADRNLLASTGGSSAERLGGQPVGTP